MLVLYWTQTPVSCGKVLHLPPTPTYHWQTLTVWIVGGCVMVTFKWQYIHIDHFCCSYKRINTTLWPNRPCNCTTSLPTVSLLKQLCACMYMCPRAQSFHSPAHHSEPNLHTSLARLNCSDANSLDCNRYCPADEISQCNYNRRTAIQESAEK